ncbi:MAG: substrate-binding domain-containing protein [Chloroflexi bacterium]|nr:substrate-binding domain-containing protein [Chloroflexota bacterium]
MKKTSMKMGVVALAVVAVAAIVSLNVTARAPSLKVATTSSLYDTGLWEYLELMFEEKYGVELDILCVGTGIALEYGKRGDVDAVVIHDKAREEQFVAEGYGVGRVPFAYNYFLIVGPPDDPAGIKGLGPEEAFKKLMEEGAENPQQIKFVSRGDESGTHAREKAIWKAAGFNYTAVQESSWAKAEEMGYIEAGRGMGPTLLMASEMNAYTLTDIGTFLAYKGKLDLVPLVEEGQILLNVYSVIAVSPEKHPDTKIEMASSLIDFLTSSEIQELIREYGVKDYGMPLFTPCAGAEPEQ